MNRSHVIEAYCKWAGARNKCGSQHFVGGTPRMIDGLGLGTNADPNILLVALHARLMMWFVPCARRFPKENHLLF
jgi:hypothetical protein